MVAVHYADSAVVQWGLGQDTQILSVGLEQVNKSENVSNLIMIGFVSRSGAHDFIGSCSSTLREVCPERYIPVYLSWYIPVYLSWGIEHYYSTAVICRGGQVFTLDIINEELKKKKKKYRNSGSINFVSVK